MNLTGLIRRVTDSPKLSFFNYSSDEAFSSSVVSYSPVLHSQAPSTVWRCSGTRTTTYHPRSPFKLHAIRGYHFMGADGRSRPASAQTYTVLPESANKSASPWLASLISPEPEEFQRTGIEGTGPSDHSGIDIRHLDQDEKGGILSENDSVERPASPTRDHHASSDHDTTPRTQTAATLHSPLVPQDRADDVPPFRQVSQDSAYESIMVPENENNNGDDESKVNVDLQASNIRARGRVEIARDRVLQTRRVISEKRPELQVLRETLRDATNEFMRAVDELMVLDNVKNLQSLVPHHQALRKAQDNLGPAEYAFDLLEARLSREEEDLEQEEMHFYTHNNISLARPPELNSNRELSPPAKPPQPEHHDFSNLNLDNQLMQDYLSKVFEAEHLKQQLHILENEQYDLTEELSFREQYNLTLSPKKAAILSSFPQAHKELLESLEDIEESLDKLRDQCLEQKLFSSSEYPYEPYDALVAEIYESVNDIRDRRALYANYTPRDVDFEKKQDYINTWLLEWMQESTVDTMQLKSFIYLKYPEDGKELVGDDWTDLALEFWDVDSAGEYANREQNMSSNNALLGGSWSSLELEDWGDILSIAPSLSPEKGAQDVGIDLPYVDRIPTGQEPIRRRRGRLKSRAHSL